MVSRAIDKKKAHENLLARKKQPKLEKILLSQFEVLETIRPKSGRTTIYHLVKSKGSNKHFCCKVLNEDQAEVFDPLFANEASRLELSQHPGVVEFVKLGTELDKPYLMYEWALGESLGQKLERYLGKGFRADHVAWLIYQLAGTLEYMHSKGICHLDIKPANIIIDENDNVKLIDFGAARYAHEVSTHIEVSTLYSSPMYAETAQASPQDDVYSLAMLAGHLLLGETGKNDWHSALKSRKNKLNIPRHTWNLIKRVINNPRQHGLTPIRFAQQFAKLDIEAFVVAKNTAPLFVNMKNADLVLTQKSSSNLAALLTGNSHASLGLAGVLLFAILFVFTITLRHSSPDMTSKSRVLLPIQPAVSPSEIADFLALPPWQQSVMLTSTSQNREKDQAYWLAFNSQKDKQNRRYIDNKSDLSDLQDLDAQALASWLTSGDVQGVQNYLKSTWRKHQAKAYFYSDVIPEKILVKVIESAQSLAQKSFYSKAIEEIDTAISFFGETSQLNDLKRDYILKRSNYILTHIASGKQSFNPEKINLALTDLQKYSPERFEQIKRAVESKANDVLRQTFEKGATVKGVESIANGIKRFSDQHKDITA
nr:protein kinase family protein [Vibrio sinus]